MIPITWLPTPRMHPVAAALQFTSDEFGEAYQRDGLRQLMRLQRNRDDYLDAISTLANQIVRIGDNQPIAPYRTAVVFEETPSAFHTRRAPPAAVSENSREINGRVLTTAQYVHFVIAAAGRDDIAVVRDNTDYYGPDGRDWAPYKPALPVPLAGYARGVAAERSFESDVVGDDELISRLDWANQHNQIVVLLVDAWVTRLDAHRRVLVECNEIDAHGHCPPMAVLVPVNHDDAETYASRLQLSDSVRSIFISKVASGDEITFRTSVLTHQSFREDLQVVLEVARNRVFVKGSVRRLPDGGPAGGRPILRGP
jgi:FxsC-like protein